MLKKTFPVFLLVAIAVISCSDPATSATDDDTSSEQMDASSSIQSSAKSSSSVAYSSGTSTTSATSPSSSSSSIQSSSVSAKYWNQDITYGVLSDSRDKKKYRTTQIGSQNWMAENLNFTATVGESYCYDAKPANCTKYGRLYNWDAASASCPDGWHLPNSAEWDQLAKFLGGSTKAGKVLKAATTLWSQNSGTDAYGFAALPSGNYDNDKYYDLGTAGLWWTSSTLSSTIAFFRNIVGSGTALRAGSKEKIIGLAVRCLQDVEIPESSSLAGSSSLAFSSSINSSSSAVVLIPPDRNCSYAPNLGTSPVTGTLTCPNNEVYKTVNIGSAVWMAQNLNYGTRVNGTASSGNQSNDGVIEKYCYEDNVENCVTDGGLYQWAEAMGFKFACNSVLLTDTTCNESISATNHQGICPTGWHMPKDSDWDALVTVLGGDYWVAGSKMKLNDTPFPDWNSLTYVANNDGNSSGFSALPAGIRYDGFSFRGESAIFWTAREHEPLGAHLRTLDSGQPFLKHYTRGEEDGLSIRCVKDP